MKLQKSPFEKLDLVQETFLTENEELKNKPLFLPRH